MSRADLEQRQVLMRQRQQNKTLAPRHNRTRLNLPLACEVAAKLTRNPLLRRALLLAAERLMDVEKRQAQTSTGRDPQQAPPNETEL